MDFRTKAFAVQELSVYSPFGLRADLQLISQAIESGTSPAELIDCKQATPLDVAAVLGFIGLESGDGSGLPLQTGQPINQQLSPFLKPTFWAKHLPEARETAVLNLSAGLLQINDFWEESHSAAQRADDLGEHRLSAHWHAICHRREPDAFNANYWWARVGRNPLIDQLGSIVTESSKGRSPGIRHLVEKLLERGTYSDRAMVTQSLAVKPGSEESGFLRRIQKYEMLLLLDLTIDQFS